MGEGAGRRPKPVRICEANTRILRAKPQPNTDVLPIESQPPAPRIKGTPDPRRIELCAGRGQLAEAGLSAYAISLTLSRRTSSDDTNVVETAWRSGWSSMSASLCTAMRPESYILIWVDVSAGRQTREAFVLP